MRLLVSHAEDFRQGEQKRRVVEQFRADREPGVDGENR